MAETFLTHTNRVIARLNEVQLTSSNFNDSGFLDKRKLKEYLLNFRENTNIVNSNLLWQLLNLEKLYSKK